jgi:hypothetical protein
MRYLFQALVPATVGDICEAPDKPNYHPGTIEHMRCSSNWVKKTLTKERLAKAADTARHTGLGIAGLCVSLVATYPLIYARDQFNQWRTLGRLVGSHAKIDEAAPYLPADATVYLDWEDTEGSPEIGTYLRSAQRPRNGTIVAYRQLHFPFHQRSRRCVLEFERDVLVRMRDEDESED